MNNTEYAASGTNVDQLWNSTKKVRLSLDHVTYTVLYTRITITIIQSYR